MGPGESWQHQIACVHVFYVSFCFGILFFFFPPYAESLWHHSSSPMTFTLPDP